MSGRAGVGRQLASSTAIPAYWPTGPQVIGPASDADEHVAASTEVRVLGSVPSQCRRRSRRARDIFRGAEPERHTRLEPAAYRTVLLPTVAGMPGDGATIFTACSAMGRPPWTLCQGNRPAE